MRMPTEYEIYFHRLKEYYRIKNQGCPPWIDNAEKYYKTMFCAKRKLSEQCSNSCIKRSTREWLSKLEDTIKCDDLPIELKVGTKDCVKILSEMYRSLMENYDEYFINAGNLTKAGRKKMREYLDQLPSIGQIKLPKTAFTNVPDSIVYESYTNSSDAGYELTITFVGSRLCIRNNDSDFRNIEYIDFNESFLDKIIPLAQWENLEPYIDQVERDESIKTHDPKASTMIKIMVYKHIGREEFTLDSNIATAYNPFMMILRLVWDEYSDLLKEKNIVLPWFDIFCTSQSVQDRNL